MWVCICEAITDKELNEVILNGANTIESVADICYATTGCGQCAKEVEKRISELTMEDIHLQRVIDIASNIKYKDWVLRVERDNSNEGGRVFLQWIFNAPCVIGDKQTEWHCRKWYLSPHMLESEVVKTAFAGALAAEEHETREKFRYKDVAPFNPHISLDVMMENARRYTTRQKPIDEEQVK